MPKIIIEWQWEEAFDKFGFGDGDRWNGTHEVVGEIESLGYECETEHWGCHNYMIFDIKKDGKSILFPERNDTGVDLDDWLPEVEQRIKDRDPSRIVYEDPDRRVIEPLGYEWPRNYLPDDIIEHLDKVFTADWEDYYDC